MPPRDGSPSHIFSLSTTSRPIGSLSTKRIFDDRILSVLINKHAKRTSQRGSGTCVKMYGV